MINTERSSTDAITSIPMVAGAKRNTSTRMSVKNDMSNLQQGMKKAKKCLGAFTGKGTGRVI